MPVNSVIPPDTRAAGQAGHINDHNEISDALTALQNAVNLLGGGGGTVGGPLDWFNVVTQFQADPTGGTDSTTPISTALNLAQPGDIVYIPSGTYETSGPLTVPPQVKVIASEVGVLNPPAAGVIIKPSAGFSGSSVISMSSGAALAGISIDGSNLPAGSVVGVEGNSAVGCIITYCYFYKASGVGIDAGSGARGWHVSHTKIDSAGGDGIGMSNHVDGLWMDVHVINSGGHGWSIAGSPANTRFIACRAEWSGSGHDGFHLTSAWGTTTGSGGCTFVGCSTDRNDNYGFGITCTGTTPILLSGCMMRRDGRNGASGGGGFAGLSVNGATCPVTVTGCSVFPGVDDTGAGTNSPQYGVSIAGASSNVKLVSGYYQGNQAGLNRASTAPLDMDLRYLTFASGTTSAPSVSAPLSSGVAVAETDVTNTLTETTIASLAIPTGVPGAASCYRINVMGSLTVQSASGTLTFRPYLGSAVAAETMQMGSVTTGAGPNSFWAEFYVTIRSGGSSAAFIAHGRGEIEFATRVNLQCSGTGTATVDATQANMTVSLTAQWATASASNSLQVTQAIIEPVN